MRILFWNEGILEIIVILRFYFSNFQLILVSCRKTCINNHNRFRSVYGELTFSRQQRNFTNSVKKCNPRNWHERVIWLHEASFREIKILYPLLYFLCVWDSRDKKKHHTKENCPKRKLLLDERSFVCTLGESRRYTSATTTHKTRS